MKKNGNCFFVNNTSFLWLCSFLCALFLFSCKNDPVDTRIEQMDSEVATALAKDIEELINPEIANGLSLKIWGVDSLVADPIAIDIDDQGNLYYTLNPQVVN
ncbi:hypothetical protein DET49_103141 [Salegentibacter sp. 24]|nr:hypothetical protein DET49_103141 [Salegentibacter sp. 24]